MRIPSLVIFDPETSRACSGNCRSIGSLAKQSFADGALYVTATHRLPVETGGAQPDLVVLRLPARRPLLEVLAPMRRAWQSVSVLAAICNVAHDPSDLLDLLGYGLDDFFCCPFSEIDLITRLHRLLPEEKASLSERAEFVGGLKLDTLVGQSKAFLEAVSRIEKVARSNATVLVRGETGVGKELFARAIHYNGTRKDRPFVPLNCSALPDSLFENELFGHFRGAYTDASSSERGVLGEAEGGTVFLDEIDALSPSAQAKLLRFLQEGEYRPLGSSKTIKANVRVIAATNANLSEMLSTHRFREDLFYRLNVLTVHVPSLRERAVDIPLLANHFLGRYAVEYQRGEFRFSPAAMRKMLTYSWPGNVRELEGILHRAVVFSSSSTIDADDIELPAVAATRSLEHASWRGAKDEALHGFERDYLTRLLVEFSGNVSQAARAANSDRRTFQRLLRKHGIERVTFQKIV